MENSKTLEIANRQLLAKSEEEVQNGYDGWCESYDNDLNKLGIAGWLEITKMFQKHAKKSKSVLDLASGTGNAAAHLRKIAGYKGEIDLLDANLNMLVVADKKQLQQRNIFCHWINDDGELPLKEEIYDVIMCGCSFVPNHIPFSALPGIIKVLKRGGLMIFDMRTKSIQAYRDCFDSLLKNMIDEKKVELVDEKKYLHYANVPSVDMSIVRVIKRLN